MGLKSIFNRLIKKHVFNPEWQCAVCGEENFDGGLICKKCEAKLPYNNKSICAHCGRQTLAPEPYCSTCAEKLTAIDRARSVFTYKEPISYLIQNLKYENHRYLVDYFRQRIKLLYLQNYFNADYVIGVPMTDKSLKKRGYNQSELLARALSEDVNVSYLDCVEKIKDTKRQAKLGRSDRLKNLKGAFKVKDKKLIKDKTLVIVDDVTTTGATAQTIAERLKSAGAKSVYLLTVASTPPRDKY